MRKLLIFGVTGFLGRASLSYLREGHYDELRVYGVGRREFQCDVPSFRYIHVPHHLEEHIEELINEIQPDYIINLVGKYAVEFSSLLETNVMFTKKLYEAIINMGIAIKKILLIGSAAEYGIPEQCPVKESDALRPITEYGLVKVYQTLLAQYYYRQFGINYNIARVFNVIGKESSRALAIGNFYHQIEQIQEQGTIHVGNLNSRRDYLGVYDVAKALFAILRKGRETSIYNVCSGQSFLMHDILQLMIMHSGKTIDVISDIGRPHDVTDIYGDNIKLVNDTGWTFERNIERVVRGMF